MKEKKYLDTFFRTSIAVYLLILITLSAKAQYSYSSDGLQKKLENYNRENPSGNLFVHTDKNNYLPGDTIWFKSYMLSALESKVLYVRIVNSKMKAVVEQQFPVYDIRAHGDVALPDTLSDGKYILYAYTDMMINFNPGDVYIQQIQINGNTPDNIEMEASVLNAGNIRRGEKINMAVRVSNKGTAVKGAKGTYNVLVKDKIIKTGLFTSNDQGEMFSNFIYPKIADNESVRFDVKVRSGKEYAELTLNLRHEGNSIKINIYPEGGDILEDIANNVVLQALDDNKNPVPVTLVLKEGTTEIDSVKTNKQGIGEMAFKPQRGEHYTIGIKENGLTNASTLPVRTAAKGYNFKIKKIKDKYTAFIYNKNEEIKASMALRSFEQLLWIKPIVIPQDDSVSFVLPLDTLPEGLLSLALFDSRGELVSERLFMNKTAKKDDHEIQITAKKQATGSKHEKIKVSISITDQQGMPAATNLSVAVIEKSTLNIQTHRTILESFYYRSLFNGTTPVNDQYYPDLDAFLITKSWGLYDWQHVLKYNLKGAIQIQTNTGGISGIIKQKKKKAVSPASLLLFSKSNADIIEINADGSFSLLPEQLTASHNEKKYLLLNNGYKFYDSYDISLINYSAEFDKRVKEGYLLNFPRPFSTNARYTRPALKIFNSAIQLKEVVISNKEAVLRKFQNCSNECGDYVCKYKVLNCFNHPCAALPVIGMTYYSTSAKMPILIYNGCGKQPTPAPPGSVPGFPPAPSFSLPLPEISIPNQFHLPDYSKEDNNGPDTRTTLFWTPNLNTDATGKTSFEFFTSDIKSDFTIVVQGLDIHTLKPVYHTYNLKL